MLKAFHRYKLSRSIHLPVRTTHELEFPNRTIAHRSYTSMSNSNLGDEDIYEAKEEEHHQQQDDDLQANASTSTLPFKPVPEFYTSHTESSTQILLHTPTTSFNESNLLLQLPSTTTNTKKEKEKKNNNKLLNVAAPVFLNPVQEYNRDLSIVAIRSWSESRQVEKRLYWENGVRRKWGKRNKVDSVGVVRVETTTTTTTTNEITLAAEGKKSEEPREEEEEERRAGKKRKGEDGIGIQVQEQRENATQVATEDKETSGKPQQPAVEDEIKFNYPTFKFTLLEALSATGLRAIRYAKEIPLLKYVIANDLSASAVEDIKRNIEWNDLMPKGLPEGDDGSKRKKDEVDELLKGKVRAHQGDACDVMYQHRSEATRFDCVDLDPYGSAVPFLDAAIGAVADGGLLCVTCTDMGVLAGHNYPEKAFTHYGGVCVNAEYSHEVALRLVLNSIATTAAKYGRHIEPLASLSIDFYVRLFIRVSTGPKEVKQLPAKTSLLYYCHDCQSPFLQPFGRVTEKSSAKNGSIQQTFHAPSGPPPGVGERCDQCGGKFHIGGPIWSGPIHSQTFLNSMLSHIQDHSSEFKTAQRIEGMLTLAQSEIKDAPLYFSPTKVCGFFHCQSASLNMFASALLNAGYSVSRSHAFPGSIKTSASREFVFDIVREWIKLSPVAMQNVKDGSPTKRLLEKEQIHKIDLTPHPDAAKSLLSDVKLVRYQLNPQANWGPAKAAIRGAAKS